MAQHEQIQLMTMSDISALARVKRPVVSVWRTRFAQTGAPFPNAVAKRGGQEVFDAAQVGTWLANTGHGNNPDALADAAGYASLDRGFGGDEGTLLTITSLLTLRALIDRPIGELAAGDLQDLADEHDPDDRFLYSELASALEELGDTARHVDALVESSLGVGPAFERLLADRFRLKLRRLGGTALSEMALLLTAKVAIALAMSQGDDSILIDSTGSSGDIILAIRRLEGDDRDTAVATPDDNSPSSRLLCRRMLVHGIKREAVGVQPSGEFAVGGQALHLAQLPPSHRPSMRSDEMLSAIDQIALQMTADHLAVVIAPAAVLTEPGLSRESAEIRSTLLRSGRVRAIVRLPVGLVRHKPQQAQAMWVLGADHAGMNPAERWTLIADLTSVVLDSGAVDDLVSDLFASLGDRAAVRARAFRFSRVVPTRTLLASRDSLVAGSRATNVTSRPAAAMALRVAELVANLSSTTTADSHGGAPVSANTPALGTGLKPLPHVDPAEIPDPLRPASVEQLLWARHLLYIPGNRIDADDIEAVVGHDSRASMRLIGVAEILGDAPLGVRRVDRLVFAADYPSGRVTEPGDVVFCTSPRPASFVDTEGTSIVLFPARILRVSKTDPGGLVPPVVAVDINVLPERDKGWKRWRFRRVQPSQTGALADALNVLLTVEHQTHQRLAQIHELTALLATGVTASVLTLSIPQDSSTSDSLAPPEGIS